MWNEHLFNLCPAKYAEDFILCLFKVGNQAPQLAHIDHPLIMNEEQEYHGEGVMCSVCEEAMSGPNDCCTFGKFFLQKKCALLKMSPIKKKASIWRCHLHDLMTLVLA
jgi:hypothetical protein